MARLDRKPAFVWRNNVGIGDENRTRALVESLFQHLLAAFRPGSAFDQQEASDFPECRGIVCQDKVAHVTQVVEEHVFSRHHSPMRLGLAGNCCSEGRAACHDVFRDERESKPMVFVEKFVLGHAGGIGHNQDAFAVAFQRLDAVAGARYRCRADVQDAVSVQKEHVVVPGNVSQRFYVPDMPVAAAWCREPVPSRLVGFECLVCRNRNQMIAPRTFAETHSLIITAARMTRRIRLTCGQASTLSDADS